MVFDKTNNPMGELNPHEHKPVGFNPHRGSKMYHHR